MKAIVVCGREGTSLRLADVDGPDNDGQSLLIGVRAFSLNRGEVLMSAAMKAGSRIGSDFAGVVESAPQCSGFAPGDRVVGAMRGGAWAERIAAPIAIVARIPDLVSFEEAAALPVVGLTAAFAVEKGGELHGRKVLVTGATGAVGAMAVQLSRKAGADVTALVRSDKHHDRLKRLGAAQVATSIGEARRHGRYDLIVDAIGGDVLGHVLSMLARRGTCVLVGNVGGSKVTFDADQFRHGEGYPFGGTALYGLHLRDELSRSCFADRLEPLLNQVAAGTLDPGIGLVRPWAEINRVASDFLNGDISGKAILTL